jgi:hypothetical protein
MKQIAEGQYLFDLRYQIDADSVKSFLAEELNSPLEKIVEGKIISEK